MATLACLDPWVSKQPCISSNSKRWCAFLIVPIERCWKLREGGVPIPSSFALASFMPDFLEVEMSPVSPMDFLPTGDRWTELKSSPFIQWFLGLKKMLVTFMRNNFTLARASHIHSRSQSAYKSEIWDSLWSRKERQKAVLSGSSAAEPSAFIAFRSFHQCVTDQRRTHQLQLV